MIAVRHECDTSECHASCCVWLVLFIEHQPITWLGAKHITVPLNLLDGQTEEWLRARGAKQRGGFLHITYESVESIVYAGRRALKVYSPCQHLFNERCQIHDNFRRPKTCWEFPLPGHDLSIHPGCVYQHHGAV